MITPNVARRRLEAGAPGSRQPPRARFVIAWSTLIIAASVNVTAAAGTPEQSCQAGRSKAAGIYAKCVEDAVAKLHGGSAFDPGRYGRCAVKYAATWAKLQAKALASPGAETCDAARYVDNGDGTVTDNLTALRWEKKTDDATIHDWENAYYWSGSGSAADGTAFTTFLAMVNGAGFAGQYDWRLPTMAELLSIAQPAYPNCSVSPCIDPIFGLTAFEIWSSSTYLPAADQTWFVRFSDGGPSIAYKAGFARYVRAVRGGI